MFRVLGWKPGLIVFVVDVSKGLVPVWVIGRWQDACRRFRLCLQLLTGAAAVLGHVWPILAGFRGGKGIATLAGSLLVLSPQSVIVGLVVFVLVIALTRYVSLSSLMAALSLPCTLLASRVWFHRNVPDVLLAASGLVVPFVFFTHRSNIKRLLTGVENSVGSCPSAARPRRHLKPEGEKSKAEFCRNRVRASGSSCPSGFAPSTRIAASVPGPPTYPAIRRYRRVTGKTH